MPEGLDDAALERRLFPPVGGPDAPLPRQIDFAALQIELKRRGATLQLLWQEYRADQPDGYGYSRFCELFGDWKKRLSPVMRQTHLAGE